MRRKTKIQQNRLLVARDKGWWKWGKAVKRDKLPVIR